MAVLGHNRRKVIKLMAAGAAAFSLPAAALAAAPKSSVSLFKWHGFAMGAEVSLQLFHPDEKAARQIIDHAIKIIRNMENLFSLYQTGSVITRLNRDGYLPQPPADFTDLLRRANRISQRTSGAFDITVQPLWHYYKARFLDQKNDFIWTPDAEFRAARALVDYQKISILPERIAFERPNMAITLNGIAQGYATDKVSDYLKSEGMTSVLVDMGEYRALGPQPDQSPWRIALADPEHIGAVSDILEVNQGAVATSSGAGDVFDQSGKYHHMMDPHTGQSADKYLSVTVTAPEATLADALSTAFCSMEPKQIEKCLKSLPSVTARLSSIGGGVTVF